MKKRYLERYLIPYLWTIPDVVAVFLLLWIYGVRSGEIYSVAFVVTYWCCVKINRHECDEESRRKKLAEELGLIEAKANDKHKGG